MKNLTNSLKQKLTSKYTVPDSQETTSRRTDINVLLNRVKSDKKQEIKNKFYFSAAASTGCLLYTSPSPRDAHESRMPSSA